MTCRRLALAGAILLASCKEPSREEPIAVGVLAPLTGANAAYGVPMRNGIELAIAEANARGKKLRMVDADTQSRLDEGANVARRLVTEERVRVLLGEASSAVSLEIAPIAQRAEVVMITPSATDPVVTELGDFIFRACFVDPVQAEVMAEVARERLKIERVSVLRDIDSAYSVALANAFVARFVKLGGEIIADEAYARTDADFGALLAKIASSGTQAIYVPGYAVEIAKIAAAAKRAKLEARLLGADGFEAASLLGELEGAYFTTHFAEEEQPAFVAAYREKFNETPDAIAALGYDAARVAFAALSDDGRAFRDALAATQSFQGVTGTISFDEKRNAKKSVVVAAIQGGRRVLIERRSSTSSPSSDPPNKP